MPLFSLKTCYEIDYVFRNNKPIFYSLMKVYNLIRLQITYLLASQNGVIHAKRGDGKNGESRSANMSIILENHALSSKFVSN
jgi:hypothetical protein